MTESAKINLVLLLIYNLCGMEFLLLAVCLSLILPDTPLFDFLTHIQTSLGIMFLLATYILTTFQSLSFLFDLPSLFPQWE